jgi:hypothetical protein
MNQMLGNQGGIVETNDNLEAVNVFRGWKNVFFGILLACLLLGQAAFWMIDLKIIAVPATSEKTVSKPATAAVPAAQMLTETSKADKTATASASLVEGILARLDYGHIARAVELIDGILIVVAVLLVATTFFSLQVSLAGRLGGLNHISRAFILALIAVVVLIPWQRLGLSVPGVTWTPDELIRWQPTKTADLVSMVTFYLRFTGYWAAVVLLLLLSQARSIRWSKSIARRLEMI